MDAVGTAVQYLSYVCIIVAGGYRFRRKKRRVFQFDDSGRRAKKNTEIENRFEISGDNITEKKQNTRSVRIYIVRFQNQ